MTRLKPYNTLKYNTALIVPFLSYNIESELNLKRFIKSHLYTKLNAMLNEVSDLLTIL